MSDLSNTLRKMKFMQRTYTSRKNSLKKSSTAVHSKTVCPLDPILATPDHPGCWRIVKNESITPSKTVPVNTNQPTIVYRNSLFSIHDRQYTRLSFQNYNKRIESLMIKYGLKQDENNLEDGEIDPDDNENDNDDVKGKKSIDDNDDETKHVSTLIKTIRKKFNKKSFSRNKFDNTGRITKRKRRIRHRHEKN